MPAFVPMFRAPDAVPKMVSTRRVVSTASITMRSWIAAPRRRAAKAVVLLR